MKIGDYGLSVRSDVVEKFSSTIEEQVSLIWQQMWANSEISGNKKITVNYHGSALAYGRVSFDLPANEAIVTFSFISKKIEEHKEVFDVPRTILLGGIDKEFSLVILSDK